jgi:hypothetical protein
MFCVCCTQQSQDGGNKINVVETEMLLCFIPFIKKNKLEHKSCCVTYALIGTGNDYVGSNI